MLSPDNVQAPDKRQIWGDPPVIQQSETTLTHDDRGAARTDSIPFGPLRATVFVRAQTAWLQRGLKHADEPAEVGLVLEAHDASHETWLGLIAETQRDLGDRAAAQLAALYGFHGRIVGSLERGPDRRLDPAIKIAVRRILAARLAELTEAATASLNP